MDPGDQLRLRYPPEFTNLWRDALVSTYKWQSTEAFCLVPDILGFGHTPSCLPLISHSHFTIEEAEKIIQQSGVWEKAIIRVIPEAVDTEPAIDDPVLMRMHIGSLGAEEVWDKKLKSVCRNRIRKSQKAGYAIRVAQNRQELEAAYSVFLDIMRRHGTPAWPFSLIENLVNLELANVFVVWRGDIPVAMLALVVFGNIAWIPWCGALLAENEGCPNHLAHWTAIEKAIEMGAEVFDFGRSPYKGGTFEFKRKWGASPIPISTISKAKSSPYNLSFAASIWKILPAPVSDRLGPIVTRRLANY